MLPAFADICQYPFAIGPHRFDNLGWSTGVFVASGPEHDLDQGGREIEPLLRQRVQRATRIERTRLAGDHAGSFESAEAIRQYVACDTFACAEEFLECAQFLEHQVTNDQQRPAIAEKIQGDADRTIRAPGGA